MPSEGAGPGMGAVLIAGCGYVGMALAERLARRGERVFGLRRSATEMPEGVVALRGDLTDPSTLTLPADIDRLVYAVAPDGSEPAQYRAAYLDGLANTIDALARAGARVRRAVMTSSTAVYAQDDASWVDETSETTASGNPALLLEGERLTQSAFPEGIALRLAGIYGPGRDRMVRTVADGTARLPRAPRYTNRIHRDDAASAIDALLSVASPESVYIGVDDEPTDLADVYRWVASELGVPLPPMEDEGASPRARGGQKRCRNARLRAAGWVPAYPTFRDGYAPAIAARRSAG